MLEFYRSRSFLIGAAVGFLVFLLTAALEYNISRLEGSALALDSATLWLAFFYLLNLVKHIAFVGFAFYIIRECYRKFTWEKVLLRTAGWGALGLIIMFVIQVNSTSIFDKLGDTILAYILVPLIYPPPFFLVAWGIVIVLPTNLILNAAIGITVFSKFMLNGIIAKPTLRKARKVSHQ